MSLSIDYESEGREFESLPAHQKRAVERLFYRSFVLQKIEKQLWYFVIVYKIVHNLPGDFFDLVAHPCKFQNSFINMGGLIYIMLIRDAASDFVTDSPL